MRVRTGLPPASSGEGGPGASCGPDRWRLAGRRETVRAVAGSLESPPARRGERRRAVLLGPDAGHRGM